MHVWIGDAWDFVGGQPTNGGHMTFPSVAVNDPVFFLHHSNVDRLWATWQRKSPTPAYVPLSGGNAGHDAGDVMVRFGTPGDFATPRSSIRATADHHALGYWYHSDPPEITLSTASIAFGSVPEQLTTFHPVQFAVRTCRPVTFTITNVTRPNFSQPPGQGVGRARPRARREFQTAEVFVAFHAVGALGDAAGRAGDCAGDDRRPRRLRHAGAGDDPRPRRHGPSTSLRPGRSAARRRGDGARPVWEHVGSRRRGGLEVRHAQDVAPGGRGRHARYGRSRRRDVRRSRLDPQRDPGDGPAGELPGGGDRPRGVLDAIASPDLVPRGSTAIGLGMISGAGVLDAERLAAGTPYSRSRCSS